MYLRTYVKIWTFSEVSMVPLTQVITLYFFVPFESEIFRLSVISLFKIGLHTRKEERSVYKNRFVRSYEVEKEDLSVKKTRLWFVFECEALKLVQ